MSERDVVESEAGLVFFHELDRLVDPDKDTEALCRVLDMRPSEETFYAARVIRAQAAELTSLRAVVDRLPVTADGVPLVPGDIVFATATWLGKDGQVVEFLWDPASVCAWNEGTPTQSWRVPITKAYSTREAAEAAREGE